MIQFFSRAPISAASGIEVTDGSWSDDLKPAGGSKTVKVASLPAGANYTHTYNLFAGVRYSP